MKSKEEAFSCLNLLIVIFFIGCGYSIYKIISTWDYYKYIFPHSFSFLVYVGLIANILSFISLIFLANYKKIGLIGVVVFSVINILMNLYLHVEPKYIIGNIVGVVLLIILSFMNWSKIK